MDTHPDSDSPETPRRAGDDLASTVAAELVAWSRPVGGLAALGGGLLAIGLAVLVDGRDGRWILLAPLALGGGLLAAAAGLLVALGLRVAAVRLRQTPGVVVPTAVPPAAQPARADAATPDERSPLLERFRQAMAAEDWDAAEAAAREWSERFPEDPTQLGDEVAAARRAHATRLRATLDAAREAGDILRVLEIRESLTVHLTPDSREDLDRDLAGSLLRLIQRRLLGGTVAADVVGLAAQVGTTFAHTREGASLMASLPTLRRSAGLCPRCGKPDTGLDDACAECLANAPTGPARARLWPADDEDDREEDAEIADRIGPGPLDPEESAAD